MQNVGVFRGIKRLATRVLLINLVDSFFRRICSDSNLRRNGAKNVIVLERLAVDNWRIGTAAETGRLRRINIDNLR